MATLRVLQIGMSASESAGGGERFFFNLMRALPACNVEPRGLVFGDAALLADNGNISSFAPNGAGLLQRWAALRHEVASSLARSDIVVSHFAPYAFPALNLLRSRPFLIHFHGPWALESAAEGAGRVSIFAKSIIERMVYSDATRFIVLSRAFRSVLTNKYGVQEDAIRVIPGGVDMHKFKSLKSRRQTREELGWPIDRPTVLTVRRLVRAKGVDNLITSVTAVKAAIPDVLFVIVGSGPLAPLLKRQVTDLGLNDSVRFVGYVPDEQLPTVYRAADLFIVPTVALEGFGLVVVEALACGTPVLVTPIAGLPEVVNDLEPGLVLAGTAPTDLADGVIKALLGRLSLPSEKSCIEYAQRFGWPVIASKISAVYREIA